MIKNVSTRKYQFFDIIEGLNYIKNEKENPTDQITKSNDINLTNVEENNPEESNISVSEISPSQMYAIDGIVFISGKAIHKLDDKLVRESLIMKIVNNKVIDQYRIYNRLYYDFQLKVFNDKIYFVSIGGDLDTYNIDINNENNNINGNDQDKGIAQLFMMSSIKIYDASFFVKYPLKKLDNNNQGNIENYRVKQIKLLKNVKTGEIIPEKERLEGLESIQNILSFAISSDFSQCAVGLDKGQIILVTGKPNLLTCSLKDIKIRKLCQIQTESHITNLAFPNIIKNNILYATTPKSIYYYTLDNNNYTEKVSELNPNEIGGGAYSNCIDVKNDRLIVASNIDSFIIEYNNLNRGRSWFFEGKKHCIKYFKNYIIFVTLDEKNASLEIYDPDNQFFIYYNDIFKRISSICSDQEHIYAFIDDESLEHKKYIIKLREKDNKDKFDTLFKKNFYDIALKYAKNLNYDEDKISQISQRNAEYAYSKGEYEKAVSQYINTINYLEPSIVIQKFLEKSKLDYLIEYLEALEKNEIFQRRNIEELKDYTTLLLNCYIMQEKFVKLKEFIEKNKKLPKNIIKSAIDVCLETQTIDLALQIAKQNNLIEDVLRILIEKQGKFSKALDYIQPDKNDKENKSQVQIVDRINLFCKFSDLFLKNEDMKDNFFLRIEQFIDEYYHKFSYDELIKLVKIFFGYDKYFKILFDKLESKSEKNNKCEQSLIHKRIELYLDDQPSERYKILEILNSNKYKDIYNKTYLLMLFREKEFSEGEIQLLKINESKNKNELLSIYMERRDYKEIISFCKKNNDKMYLDLALNYFASSENRIPKKGEDEKELNEEMNKYLKILLDDILENKLMIPVHALDILKKSNPKISFKLIRNFMEKSFKNEEEPLQKNKEKISQLKEELNNTKNEIIELKTKSCTLLCNNCNDCGLSISLPAVYFLCHHSYHSLCLRANINEGNNFECLKCEEKRKKLIENFKMEREKIITLDKFSEAFKNNGLYSIYGKGIMDFRTLNFDFNNKNIKIEDIKTNLGNENGNADFKRSKTQFKK